MITNVLPLFYGLQCICCFIKYINFVTSTSTILDTLGKEFHALTSRIIKTAVNNLKVFIKRCYKWRLSKTETIASSNQ